MAMLESPRSHHHGCHHHHHHLHQHHHQKLHDPPPQCKGARIEACKNHHLAKPSSLCQDISIDVRTTTNNNEENALIHDISTNLVTDQKTMNFPQKLGYGSTTVELSSFFNPPDRTRQGSPRGDEPRHSFPWGLTVDTAFGDTEDDGSGCGHSSTATLCEALGIPSPATPKSPISPKSVRASAPSIAFTGAEQPQHTSKENGDSTSFSTRLVGGTAEELLSTSGKATDMRGPTVFVWDLDETLIIFQTLLNGHYAELFDGFKDSHKAISLGRRWERLILEVCDDYFNYKQVEEYNYAHVNSLQDYDDGIDLEDYDFEYDDLVLPPFDVDNLRKLTYRHRYACNLYKQGLEGLLSMDQKKEWQELYESTDEFTDQWLSGGRKKVAEFQQANQMALQEEFSVGVNVSDGSPETVGTVALPSTYNFLVTSGTLIPSLVKCMLFKLNFHFHHTNIFSSRECGKLQCFQCIRDCFVPKMPKFCVLGDGIDEEEAARSLQWPFLKISVDPAGLHRLPALSYRTIEEHLAGVYKGEDGLNTSGSKP